MIVPFIVLRCRFSSSGDCIHTTPPQLRGRTWGTIGGYVSSSKGNILALEHVFLPGKHTGEFPGDGVV